MFLGSCIRTTAVLAAIGLCGPLLWGCSSSAKLELDQPFAPPSQQTLKLTSCWAFATRGGEGYACLLAFPRPGAPATSRDFLVYVVAPTDQGEFAVAPEGARGFLIQEVGRLGGKTPFAEGRVRLQPVWFRPHRRRLKLDVCCVDGTHVTGQALLQDSFEELSRFQRRYDADIVVLMSAGQDEARPAGATDSRPASPP